MFKIKLGGIDVFYESNLDGGGSRFGQAYIKYFIENNINANHIVEWCCGPGFIGFSLLGHGLCNQLTLIDINPKALESCRETIKKNNLQDKVQVIQTASICNISLTDTPWEIIVANPPHWSRSDLEGVPDCSQLLYLDKSWSIHREFYKHIKNFIDDNSKIIIQENIKASSTDDFKEMIESNHLFIEKTEICDEYPNYYFIWSKLK